MEQLYRDPTLEAAQRMEINERRCAVCVRRATLTTGKVLCGVGKTYPCCKGSRDNRGYPNGFMLDDGIDHGAAANE